jgi:hypothetical protein
MRLSHVRWQDLATLAVAALAFALYPRLPILAWLLPFGLSLAYLTSRFIALPSLDKAWLSACCAGALLILVTVLGVFGYHDPLAPRAHLDDFWYLRASGAIADAWRSGFYPALSQKGSPPYLGSLHTGYERALASLFLVFGASVNVGIALNAVCAALMPLLGFLLADSLFADVAELAAPATVLGRRVSVPRAAALLCTVHLGYTYWATWLLKDMLLAALFGTCLLLLADAVCTRRILPAVGFVLLTGYVCILRAYTGLALVLAVALYVIARLPRRVALWAGLYVAILVVALGYTMRGGQYFSQLGFSLGNLIPLEAQTITGSIIHFGRGIPRLVLGPYAWVKAEGTMPQYGAYPGMWLLYLIVYPLCAAGFVRAVRKDHQLTIVPLTCVFSGAMIFLIAYGGNANRQRLWMELIFIVYAACGLGSPRRRTYLVGWYALLALFALAQLVSLRLR